MRFPKARSVLLVALVLVITIGLQGRSVYATGIEPGFDLFETQLGTFVNLGPRVIVDLMGKPIDPANLGSTDTIVERLQGIAAPPGTIPIEIVALSLVSVAPVNIGGSFFDVFVVLDPGPQLLGSMTVRHQFANGGTFDATLPVRARLTFTEVGNPVNTFTRTVEKLFFTTNAAWSHDPPPGYPVNPLFPPGGFFPAAGEIQEMTKDPSEARHTVVPARFIPVGGEILPVDTTALFIAGAFTSAYWILPMVAGIAGAIVFANRIRRSKTEKEQ